MKFHYLQHVPFESLACLSDFVSAPGNSVTATKFYEDQKLPFIEICDILIVMGGPMGVYDDHLYPWLRKEKEFIEKALSKNKKVIGICLGAQLLADVLGAKVYKNEFKEIGWFPISKTADGKNSPLFNVLPETQIVFHWHGDTFDLPAGAKLIASSQACQNQLFAYNQQALGIQFHMEMRKEDIKAIIENCKNELTEGPFIQKEEELINDTLIKESNQIVTKLISDFVNA